MHGETMPHKYIHLMEEYTMQKYYRTYTTHITTPNGYSVYAGKHETTIQDVSKDNYFGSGYYPKNAVQKYGMSCITKIEWFEHDLSHIKTPQERSIELGNIEIEHIKKVRKQYGTACKNIAGGGDGNVWAYADDEFRLRHSSGISKALKGNPLSEKQLNAIKTRISPDFRSKMSDIATKYWSVDKNRNKLISIMNTPEMKNKMRDINLGRKVVHTQEFLTSQRIRIEQREQLKQQRKVQRAKASEERKLLRIEKQKEERKLKHLSREDKCSRIANAMRTGEHWKHYDNLFALWVDNNKPKYVAFRKIAVTNGYPDVNYSGMVKQFDGTAGVLNAPKLPDANWHYYDELYEIWLIYDKPSTNKKFCNIIDEWLYPEADYTDMLNKFKEGA